MSSNQSSHKEGIMCLMFMLAQILTEENLNHQSRDYHYSTAGTYIMRSFEKVNKLLPCGHVLHCDHFKKGEYIHMY